MVGLSIVLKFQHRNKSLLVFLSEQDQIVAWSYLQHSHTKALNVSLLGLSSSEIYRGEEPGSSGLDS